MKQPKHLCGVDVIYFMMKNTNLNENGADLAYRAIIDTVSDALAHHKMINLENLGSFKTKLWKSRKGRNPSTGEEINIPARNHVNFIPSKVLKDAINQ